MQKIAKLFILISLLLPVQVWAHGKISTNPKNGAELKETISQMDLNFTSHAQLMKVSLKNENGEMVELTQTPSDVDFYKSYKLEFEALPKGKYEMKWKGVATDGHPMKGTVKFTVK